MGDLLRRSLEDAPVIRKGDYDYFVHPLTDGVPPVDPALLREVCAEVEAVADLDANRILTAEAMGIPLATALSLRTGIPMAVVRKRPYGLPGEIAVDQETGYSKGELFINGVEPGDRVLIVDDVISTGGTLAAILTALQRRGVAVADVVVVFEKGSGKALIQERFGIPVKTLQRVGIVNRVVVPR